MDSKEKREPKENKTGMREKLAFFKEVKEKLAEIEMEMHKKKWGFACETCKLPTLVFHNLKLYPNEIRYFCSSCAVAGRISEGDRKKIGTFIKRRLGIKENLDFDFIVDINDSRSN